jgi:hypothetical protein
VIRTIKAISLGLNCAKWVTLVAIAEAYASEKDEYLSAFNDDATFATVDKHTDYRDALLV